MSYNKINLERFNGLAEIYDQHRPQPPLVLLEMISQWLQPEPLRLVVDIACGTGLSTFVWTNRAEQVIGLEPNSEMRQLAQANQHASSSHTVQIRDGLAHQTNLPDTCADLVTCAQALHWLEPTSTFTEVGRILRPKGLFVAYDYWGSPIIDHTIEMALNRFWGIVKAKKQLGFSVGINKWPKESHLQRMEESGQFQVVRRTWLHHQEKTNVTRLLGYVRSLSNVATLLKHGLSEDEIGLTQLSQAVHDHLGDKTVIGYFSYSVWLGVK